MGEIGNKTIAKNTMFLYFRMLLVMGVSLYTSRLILKYLGVEDFGIYSVVGGTVALLSFLNSAMASASQRFLTFELGKGIEGRFREVFSITISIHVLLAIVMALLVEVVGLWFLNNRLNIPPDRLEAAFWVFQCSVIGMIFSITQVPYNAAIIAHERMKVFAFISIAEVLLKLSVVFILATVNFDKLILYAVLMLLTSVIVRLVYFIYCKTQLKDCSFKFVRDAKTFKSILSYAGYNIIGHISVVARTHGVNLLLNLFFGPVVNAANAIAMQLKGTIDTLAQNFTVAVNPQIVKSYASDDRARMFYLITQSSKFSFFLIALVCIPLIIETDFILDIWLANPPVQAAMFCKLLLINTLIDGLSGTLVYGVLATGNIKRYQLFVAGLLLSNIPIAYVLLKLGYSENVVFISGIFISFLALFLRLYMIRKLLHFHVMDYLKNVVVTGLFVILCALIPPLVTVYFMDPDWIRLFVTIGVSVISQLFFVYMLGVTTTERAAIKQKVFQFIKIK